MCDGNLHLLTELPYLLVPSQYDLGIFRGLFTYAVIEMTTQVTHVNNPVPSAHNIAGTHRQHGPCR